jgi:hypothetical protein
MRACVCYYRRDDLVLSVKLPVQILWEVDAFIYDIIHV